MSIKKKYLHLLPDNESAEESIKQLNNFIKRCEKISKSLEQLKLSLEIKKQLLGLAVDQTGGDDEKKIIQ